jgi:hypothetical protein
VAAISDSSAWGNGSLLGDALSVQMGTPLRRFYAAVTLRVEGGGSCAIGSWVFCSGLAFLYLDRIFFV